MHSIAHRFPDHGLAIKLTFVKWEICDGDTLEARNKQLGGGKYENDAMEAVPRTDVKHSCQGTPVRPYSEKDFIVALLPTRRKLAITQYHCGMSAFPIEPRTATVAT